MNVIKLFDYQEDMKERIEKALRLHRSVMAQMPTGTGKTVLLASVVESFLREHSNCNVWIVAHRRELVSQIQETIERVFSKTHPSSLTIKEDFSNHPVNSSKITPSLFTLKEGSTSHPGPLTLRGEGGNRPTRCSEPLRSKVGGPSKVSPDCAGWDRLTDTCLRAADGLAPIQVLVNVDIFSEGFDCPDVEFVQLARPTLSLAKYLQMVGRGLRVAKGKKNCVIIDNVGLYRVFGLPSQVWNWNAMFEGKLKVGKRKETPKDREFFLMNEKQDDIQIHPDSEMMLSLIHI